jgi:hypothetical protein
MPPIIRKCDASSVIAPAMKSPTTAVPVTSCSRWRTTWWALVRDYTTTRPVSPHFKTRSMWTCNSQRLPGEPWMSRHWTPELLTVSTSTRSSSERFCKLCVSRIALVNHPDSDVCHARRPRGPLSGSRLTVGAVFAGSLPLDHHFPNRPAEKEL